ncbi:hypothetical protein BOTBODRAFT_104411 [Botryobasidium botryosum FD-172 SS1]|uniref:Deoxycytidylate deaminase n=1 Tax=Botryobasidium botryosum (strain FD-172 SS1) TaxID=930990 RepID=A0A067MRM8_BOTB1|nr:hypothetical protein BOTBODRAFT_104411 [Botryobasidium botryosum FD-172 SS1]
MFIGIIGTACSGKKAVEKYLLERDFTPLRLQRSDSSGKYFADASSMLDYATHNWRENHVTTCLDRSEILEPFIKRPFFLLLSVDAPIFLRWKRAVVRCEAQNVLPPSLETYVQADDELNPRKLHPFTNSDSPHLHIFNDFTTFPDLHAYLDNLDLFNEKRLRPDWDTYFMTLASLTSRRSNCMKRRVGAILVRNSRIVATGYNGTPRNMKNCNAGGCARCNGSARSGQALNECLCLHAEENALLEAGRERVGDGAILYCNTCPCLRCSVKIVQTGVKEVVYSQAYSMDDASATVLREGGVSLRQHCSPPFE